MPLKLNQVIAMTPSRKSDGEKTLTEMNNKVFKKPELFSGITRHYEPLRDDGERFPDENKLPQFRVGEVLKRVSNELRDMFDVVATQDYANTAAKADVVVDKQVLLKSVPVTYLLFLEKRLVDLHTFVDNMPVLDPAESWGYDKNKDFFVTDQYKTSKTKKQKVKMTLSEPTEHHPAQVHVYDDDVVIGYWTNQKFSGAVEARFKNDMLERIRKLQDAVKCAREEANSTNVEMQNVGGRVLDFVFQGKL